MNLQIYKIYKIYEFPDLRMMLLNKSLFKIGASEMNFPSMNYLKYHI